MKTLDWVFITNTPHALTIHQCVNDSEGFRKKIFRMNQQHHILVIHRHQYDRSLMWGMSVH